MNAKPTPSVKPTPEDHSEKVSQAIQDATLIVALSDDRPFPILYCVDCKERITAAQRRQYWAEMVDMNAYNGWELHHIACKPVPTDRMMGDMPHYAQAMQQNLIKPSGKNGGKR